MSRAKVLGFSIGGVILIIFLFLFFRIANRGLLPTTSSLGMMQYDSEESYGGQPAVFSVTANTKSAAPSQIAEGRSGMYVPQVAEVSQTERLIIKTGQISMVVKNVPEAVKAINTYVLQKGGFVVTSNIEENGVAPTAQVTVRIPAEVFDAGVEDVKKMGEVKSERVNGQDVTAEYVDLESQLKNLQATEQQFLRIMERAVDIGDVLAVQRELGIVRGQIEVSQGRMKYLSASAKLSTLTLYISTDPATLPVVDDEDVWKPIVVFKDAARSLVEFGKGFVNGAIWLAVYIPVWLLIILVVWGVRRFFRRRREKKLVQ